MAVLLTEPRAACSLQHLHTVGVKPLPRAEPPASPQSEGPGSLESLCGLESLTELCAGVLCPCFAPPVTSSSLRFCSLNLQFTGLCQIKKHAMLSELCSFSRIQCAPFFLLSSTLLSLASFSGVAVVLVLGNTQ